MADPVVIGVAVVEHEGRYLVGTRGDAGPLPGYAEFPGGKCRTGETPAECARRECLEETGLEVQPEMLLRRQPFAYPHGTVDLHFWLCRLVRSGDAAAGHAGFRWVAAADLAALQFPPANKAVVEKLTGGLVGGEW